MGDRQRVLLVTEREDDALHGGGVVGHVGSQRGRGGDRVVGRGGVSLSGSGRCRGQHAVIATVQLRALGLGRGAIAPPRGTRPARGAASRGLPVGSRRAVVARPRAGWEVDALWQRERVALDSYGFHATRAAFERDRRKTSDLTRRRCLVLRTTWTESRGSPARWSANGRGARPRDPPLITLSCRASTSGSAARRARARAWRAPRPAGARGSPCARAASRPAGARGARASWGPRSRAASWARA